MEQKYRQEKAAVFYAAANLDLNLQKKKLDPDPTQQKKIII